MLYEDLKNGRKITVSLQ